METLDFLAIQKQIEDLTQLVKSSTDDTKPPKWWENQEQRISSLESRMNTNQGYVEQILSILISENDGQETKSPDHKQEKTSKPSKGDVISTQSVYGISSSSKFFQISRRVHKVLKDFRREFIDQELFKQGLQDWVLETYGVDDVTGKQPLLNSPFLIDELHKLDLAFEGVLFQQLLPCSPFASKGLKEDRYLALEDFLHVIVNDFITHNSGEASNGWHKTSSMVEGAGTSIEYIEIYNGNELEVSTLTSHVFYSPRLFDGTIQKARTFSGESDDFIDEGYDSGDDFRSSIQNGIHPDVNLKNVLTGVPSLLDSSGLDYNTYKEVLESEPPEWILDGFTTICMQYSALFTTLIRGRFHCRLDPLQGVLINTINNAAQVTKHYIMDWTCTRGWLNLVVGLSMVHEIYKSSSTLKSYCQVDRSNPKRSIPLVILKGAKGLAILTIVKVGVIVAYKVGNMLFFYKRDGSQLDLLSVLETSQEPLLEVKDNINSAYSLSVEAAYINLKFSQQILVRHGNKVSFDELNPFVNEGDEVASVAYRYIRWKLDNDMQLDARCEIQSVVDKLETQRGAVLATELKNNANKLAKWTAQVILANVDLMGLGHVSRVHHRDHFNHVILGVVRYKQWLISWDGLPFFATWKDFVVLLSQIRYFDPWGQGSSKREGIVTVGREEEKHEAKGIGDSKNKLRIARSELGDFDEEKLKEEHVTHMGKLT
ncbi:Eukaryotic translation initiation factor 3 subunit D [Hibiscus syriacus]|uniref:Eukaryotic translation initiation factor 3 subunit D n=1 Tax=Hibiscus syriacus TaxID=106335 RepID=A0A6A3AVG6_HIBSY|nr:Eukaryotic translation initiation factor 3 subunit D [Hibiscus syriacus]